MPAYEALLGGVRSWPRRSDPYSSQMSQALSNKYERLGDVYDNGIPEFAPSMTTTPQLLTGHLTVPHATARTRSAVVSRIPRMNGIEGVYGYGAVNMGGSPRLPSGDNTGTVASSDFQPLMQQLHFYSKNLKWYIAYPNGAAVFQGSNPVRYQYYSMRVPQISTRVSGGPGPVTMTMQPKPRWNAVQKVKRAVAQVKYFSTLPQQGAHTTSIAHNSTMIGSVSSNG